MIHGDPLKTFFASSAARLEKRFSFTCMEMAEQLVLTRDPRGGRKRLFSFGGSARPHTSNNYRYGPEYYYTVTATGSFCRNVARVDETVVYGLRKRSVRISG
jgi:hypothetical protein